MRENLNLTPAQEYRIHYRTEFFREVASRLGERVMLDDTRLPIRRSSLPIGGREGLSNIESFMPRMIKSFNKLIPLDQLDEHSKRQKVKELNANEEIWQRLQAKGSTWRVKSVNTDNTQLLNHIISSLGLLVSIRNVNYQGLKLRFDKLRYSDKTSVWNDRTALADIPEILREIHNTTLLMLKTQHGAPFDKQLRAAHFYAAGFKIYRELLPKELSIKLPGKKDVCIN